MTSPSSVSRNIPQWQNDIAVVMRVAMGGRKFIVMPPGRHHDDRFTEKMQRQFGRVAKSVGLTMVVGIRLITLRDDKLSRGAAPMVQSEDPSEVAVRLLQEYRERGGRMP